MPIVEPIAGPALVLVDVEAAVAQVADHEIRDRALLAGRARHRGELAEQVEDVRLHRGRYATSTLVAVPSPLKRCGDELAEERRRPRRPRLELGMELRGDEPWVVGQLDDLDEPALLERPADHEARVDELLAVGVVDLVAVPVTLGDHRLVAVHLARARFLGQLDGLRAEAHRAAEILDLLLLRQQVDDRERRLGIHLGRVGAVEAADVTRELGDRDVHAEADAEVRNAVLARDAAGEDLPLPAARAEASRHEDAVDVRKLARASSSVMSSASTQRTWTRQPFAMPACLSASCTER